MYSSLIQRLFICFPLLIIFLFSPVLLPAEEEKAAEQQENGARQKLNLIDAYKLTNSLPKDLIDLQTGIAALNDLQNLEDQLPVISKQIEEAVWVETSLKSDPNLTFHTINSFEGRLSRISSRLDSINSPIQDNISKLEAWHKKWLASEKKLQETIADFESEYESGDMFPEFYALIDIIAKGKDLIFSRLRANLLAGHEIGKLQTRIYEMKSTAANLVAEMNSVRTQQTSPSMLSADFYKQVSRQQFIEGWENLRRFVNNQINYLSQNLGLVIISLLIIVMLAFFVNLSKNLVKPSSPWTDFAAKPVITAIFIFSLSFSLISLLSTSLEFPPDWNILIYLPLLFSVGNLSQHLFKTKLQATVGRYLFIYISLALIMTLINLPISLFYLFVFYASIFLFAFYFFHIIRYRAAPAEKWSFWGVLIRFFFPFLIIIFGIGGYDQLAVFIFVRLLAFIAVTLALRLMLLFVSGFLELLLNNTPWDFIRNNAATMVKQVAPLLALLHFILWLASVLVIAARYPTLNMAFSAMSSVQLTIFSVIVTPGSVLTVVLIVYLTLLVSRGLRAFLMQHVLPYQRVEKGVQISIGRLVHYAVMTIGFIILLRVLGFGLNQITILGGALSVGIGFGLQAIVSNFVSGLILLFERPIKVGDMIDVGDQVGEVKELGLRATTVQTFDNAEVVIPNSQLISGNVTNWTLAEKKIRLKVPVGVAYGTDVSEVFKILLACAEDNPSVLSTPKPTALFLAFGASSLADFNDKFMVLSELNQEIESEFALAGIEIPFPQTDLHLRSVGEEAAESLHGAKTRTRNDRAETPETE